MTAFVLVGCWFMLSQSLEIRSRVTLWLYLDERGVDMVLLKLMLPGTIEKKYSQWCAASGEAGTRRLRLRYLLVANAFASLFSLVGFFVYFLLK